MYFNKSCINGLSKRTYRYSILLSQEFMISCSIYLGKLGKIFGASSFFCVVCVSLLLTKKWTYQSKFRVFSSKNATSLLVALAR